MGISADETIKKPAYWDKLEEMFNTGQDEQLGVLETGYDKERYVDKDGKIIKRIKCNSYGP